MKSRDDMESRALRRDAGVFERETRDRCAVKTDWTVLMSAQGSKDIYFCGSIRGGRQDAHIYQRIVKALQQYGRVLTEHVGYASERVHENGDGDRAIHDRDVQWLSDADVIVAEVTQPSLGVGYELGRAVAMNKRVLCLFRPSSGKALSAMIRGASSGSLFLVQDYGEDDVERLLEEYFHSITKT